MRPTTEKHQTAPEAMADLYRTLPEPAAEGWLEARSSGEDRKTGAGTLSELRDPWANPRGGVR